MSYRPIYCAITMWKKWRVGTISSQLGVHHSTIKRVLSEAGIPKKKILVQSSMMDAYLSFVLDTLQRYPTLTASRLFSMVQERGYPGGIDHFRHLISCYRPKPPAEAYLRLRTLQVSKRKLIGVTLDI